MDYDVKMCDAVLRGNDIWKITTRSIKKHKVYAMQPSNLTGIVNKGNRICFLIFRVLHHLDSAGPLHD